MKQAKTAEEQFETTRLGHIRIKLITIRFVDYKNILLLFIYNIFVFYYIAENTFIPIY